MLLKYLFFGEKLNSNNIEKHDKSVYTMYILKNLINFTMDSVKLSKWGNSYGIRITKKCMSELNLAENSNLKLVIRNKSIVLTPVKNILRLKDLLKRVNTENRPTEDYFGKPLGKEIW